MHRFGKILKACIASACLALVLVAHQSMAQSCAATGTGLCTTLGPNLIYNGNFEVDFTSPVQGQKLTFGGTCTQAPTATVGYYSISAKADACKPGSDNTQNGQRKGWRGIDHTFRDLAGYNNNAGIPKGHFLINDPPTSSSGIAPIYSRTIPVCPNSCYSFSFWAKNVLQTTDPDNRPSPVLNLSFNGVDFFPANVTIVSTSSSTVSGGTLTVIGADIWQQLVGTWYSGANTSVTFSIENRQAGTAGNDLGIDDIYFGRCGRSIVTTTNPAGNICVGNPLTLQATITTDQNTLSYVFQRKDGTVWTNINTVTSVASIPNIPQNYSYTIPVLTKNYVNDSIRIRFADSPAALASAGCSDVSNYNLTINDVSAYKANTTSVTCNGTTANSNGRITLTGFAANDHFAFNTGNSYTGNATYASAPVIPANGIIANNLANPTSPSQNYTVRVFRSNGCTKDTTLALMRACNQFPVAKNDSTSTQEDIPVIINVTTNDSDTENNLNTSTVDLNPAITGIQTTFTVAGQGTYTVTNTGAVTFTPVLNYNGKTTPISYTIQDNQGLISNTATITVTVIPVNDPPLVKNDTIITPEDTQFKGNLRTNDSDIDSGDTLRISPVTNAATQHGKITVATNGFYTYTPELKYNGPDNYSYTVCDKSGACTSAVLVITVTPVNDKPLALDDFATTDPGISVKIGVKKNDSDPDGTPLTITVIVNPKKGTASVINGDSVSYTPNSGFTAGYDTLTYKLCDAGALCDTAIIVIAVPKTNLAPIAVTDTASTPEDKPVTVFPLQNDSDPNTGDQISLTGTPTAKHGLVTKENEKITYTPNPDFNGTDTVGYTVCDLALLCSPGIVVIKVIPVNDPPIVRNETVSTPKNIPVTVSPLSNDNDTKDNGNVRLEPAPAKAPKNGVAVVNGTAVSVIYTPKPDFVGKDTMIVSVCDNGTPMPSVCRPDTIFITVTTKNDAPLLKNDTITTPEDTPFKGNVRSNDSDPDTGDSLRVTPASNARALHGTITLGPDGNYTYTPDLNYNGPDSYTYTACDKSAACATALLVVKVTPVNDPPVAINNTLGTNAGNPVSANVTGNDTDVDGTINVTTVDLEPNVAGIQVTKTVSGQGTFTAANTGIVTFVPDPGFTGTSKIPYTVKDNEGLTSNQADITVSVTPAGTPVAVNDSKTTSQNVQITFSVTANDTDSDGNINAASVDLDPSVTGIQTTFTVTGQGIFSADNLGNVTFTPALNYIGTVTPVSYTVKDNLGNLSNTALISVIVIPVTELPIAENNVNNTLVNIPVTGNVLLNDTDPQGLPLTVNIVPVATPLHGSVVLSPDGTYQYTPAANYTGQDQFTYQVCNSANKCASALVNIDVLPSPSKIPFKPVAVNDDAGTLVNTPVVITVKNNDKDFQGKVITVTGTTFPDNGTVTINPDGTISYTPKTNFTGPDQFAYFICNNSLPESCDTAIVTVEVYPDKPGNDEPKAQDDQFTTQVNTPLTMNVRGNDKDPENNTLGTPGIISVPVIDQGTVSADPVTGAITFVPKPGYVGPVNFNYQVCDGQTPEKCDTANVSIVVLPYPPLPPTARNDAVTTENNGPVSLNVTTNDTDPNGNLNKSTVDLDTLSPGIQRFVFIPHKGSVSVDENGRITFTPNPYFRGQAPVPYRVSDSTGLVSNIAWTIITVEGEDPFFIPQALTPNGDGNNDVFMIQGAENLTVVLYIYNRWGNLVYSSSDYKNDWDGTIISVQDPGNKTKVNALGGTSKLPDGTYFYVVEIGDYKKSSYIELRR